MRLGGSYGRAWVRHPVVCVGVCGFLWVLSFTGAGAGIKRVSVSSDGAQGDRGCGYPSLSNDGQFVVFESSSSNLIENDNNSRPDVFLHHSESGKTIRMSESSEGTEATDKSQDPTITADGRYVVFESYAVNITPGLGDRCSRIILRDRVEETVEVVSLCGMNKAEGSCDNPAINGNGRFIVFSSRHPLSPDDENFDDDIYLRDREAGTTTKITEGYHGGDTDGRSLRPDISDDGRLIVFESRAGNLVKNDYNDITDIFLFDRETGLVSNISRTPTGGMADGESEKPRISGDGSVIVFQSRATNLVPGDFNGKSDIFVHHLETGKTERISRNDSGMEGNDNSVDPSVSDDGNRVVFTSRATNLVSEPATDSANRIYLHDCAEDKTILISEVVGSGGTVGSSDSAAISGDGSAVVFKSTASKLVPDDTNHMSDIFLWRNPEKTTP